MTRHTPTLILILLLISAFNNAHAQTHAAEQTAQYRITFTSTWNEANHPAWAMPSGAHFSRLVGATHNSNVTFWAIGKIATNGIESMAETGGTSILRNEADSAINSGTANQTLLGNSLFTATGSITLESVTVHRDYPLVTLVTMIAPSPDWFTGVDRLSLQDEQGNWIAEKAVDVFWYDAGTDSGTNFTSANMNTHPPEPIRKLSGTGPFADIPLGSMTFTRTDAPVFKAFLPLFWAN